MTRDDLIRIFCNESKKNNYKNLTQHALSFFGEYGYTEDKMHRDKIFYGIGKTILGFNKGFYFYGQLYWLEEHIDKKDRYMFYGYYIDPDLSPSGFMRWFFYNLQTREAFEKFDEFFGTNITQNGLGEEVNGEGVDARTRIFTNAIIRKIIDPESKDLENFLVDVFKQSVHEVTKEGIAVEDTLLLSILLEYDQSAPKGFDIDEEYLKKKIERIYPRCSGLINLLGIESLETEEIETEQESSFSMR